MWPPLFPPPLSLPPVPNHPILVILLPSLSAWPRCSLGPPDGVPGATTGLSRAARPCAGPRGSLSFGGGPARSPSRRLQHPLGSSLLLSGAPPCFSALGVTSVSGPGPNRPPHSAQPQGWVTSLACHASAPPRLPFAPAAEHPAASSGQSWPRQPLRAIHIPRPPLLEHSPGAQVGPTRARVACLSSVSRAVGHRVSRQPEGAVDRAPAQRHRDGCVFAIRAPSVSCPIRSAPVPTAVRE